MFTTFYHSFKRPFMYMHTNLHTQTHTHNGMWVYVYQAKKAASQMIPALITQQQQQQKWCCMLCPFFLSHSFNHSISIRPDTELYVLLFIPISTSQPTQTHTRVHISRAKAASSKQVYTNCRILL